MPNKETKLTRFEILRSELERERSSFISHWRDLGDFILPMRPRFTVTDANEGKRKNHKIIDSTATMASRTLRAGMMSGVTSPARPWFRLSTPHTELNELEPVKAWLHDTSEQMKTAFLRSNLYNVLPIIYGDMGTFGTSAMFMEEDFDSVFRFYSFPIGSYMLFTDEKNRVNGFFREFRYTVRQLVDKFGKQPDGSISFDNISDHVQHCWNNHQREHWVDVCHAIVPNDDYDPNKIESKYKKYLSCYYEKGTSGKSTAYISNRDDDTYLRLSGYDYFPVLAPRWEVTGEDIYGTECPGMIALGDIKALQLMQRRKAQAIEKMVNPPMKAPSSLMSQKASILPGDITYYDDTGNGQGFSPIHEVNFRINELLLDIQDHQKRIGRAYYEDLFLMLANTDRRQITAREIQERHEEKLLALGPVLEQINQDLLDPLIDNAFEIMIRQGLIPEPPEELQGVDLKVEYISIMAQAQKLVGIASVERFTGFASEVAAVNPETLDKVDTDQMIDLYAEMTSIPPGIVRSDADVDEIRQQRAQAQQAAQQQEALSQGATAAKDLSQADLEGNNALSELIGQSQAGQLAPV